MRPKAFVAMLATWLGCAASPVAVSAAAPGPIVYHTERQAYLSPIDSQGCWGCDPPWYVVNPTTSPDWYHGEPVCAWNDQDDILRVGTGDVDPSTPSADRLCLLADLTSPPGTGNRPHSVYVNVFGPRDTLDVTLANDAGDRWSADPPVPSGNLWLWRICVRDPVADRAGITDAGDLGSWPEVPGSNGGRAQRVEYTLTIASPERSVRGVTAAFEVAGTGPTSAAPRAITDCGETP